MYKVARTKCAVERTMANTCNTIMQTVEITTLRKTVGKAKRYDCVRNKDIKE